MKSFTYILLLLCACAHAQNDTTGIPEYTGGFTPVDFMGIETSRDNEVVIFNWSTATELNNDYFTIEISADAWSWQEIGRVFGAGTTNMIQHYTWKYSNADKAYYRLSQTDYDWTMEILAIVVVQAHKMPDIQYFDMQGRPTTADAPGMKIMRSEGITRKIFKLD